MTQTKLQIPSLHNGPMVDLDLTPLYEAEARICEVAAVTKLKAPELLSYFNTVYAQGSRLVVMLRVAQDQAKKELSQAKAIVLLDKMPAILKEKGLKGSTEIRQAILDRDEDYIRAQDRLDEMNAYYALVRGKLDSVRMSYDSVKKILGESGPSYLGATGLNGGDSDQEIDMDEDGFGKAKYKK